MQELRRLHQFVVLAEELHFGRAAARLNMTQPPLSIQLRRLEDEIGAVLLIRGNRRVELTAAGRTLLVEARRVLQQADRAVALTRRAAAGEVGSLRIGFVSTLEYSLLPALLRRYRERYPAVELTLRELTTDAQMRAFERDELDVGFVLTPVESGTLRSRIILTEPLVAALPAAHPLAATEASVDFAALAGDGFILPPRAMATGYHDGVIAAARAAGFALRIAQQAVQMQTIVSLVSAGIGVAAVPACMRTLRRDGVVYRDIAGGPSPLSTAIVWCGTGGAAAERHFVALARSIAAFEADAAAISVGT